MLNSLKLRTYTGKHWPTFVALPGGYVTDGRPCIVCKPIDKDRMTFVLSVERFLIERMGGGLVHAT